MERLLAAIIAAMLLMGSVATAYAEAPGMNPVTVYEQEDY